MFVCNTRLGYIWTEVMRAAGRRGLRARLRGSATTVWNYGGMIADTATHDAEQMEQ